VSSGTLDLAQLDSQTQSLALTHRRQKYGQTWTDKQMERQTHWRTDRLMEKFDRGTWRPSLARGAGTSEVQARVNGA